MLHYLTLHTSLKSICLNEVVARHNQSQLTTTQFHCLYHGKEFRENFKFTSQIFTFKRGPIGIVIALTFQNVKHRFSAVEECYNRSAVSTGFSSM